MRPGAVAAYELGIHLERSVAARLAFQQAADEIHLIDPPLSAAFADIARDVSCLDLSPCVVQTLLGQHPTVFGSEAMRIILRRAELGTAGTAFKQLAIYWGYES